MKLTPFAQKRLTGQFRSLPTGFCGGRGHRWQAVLADILLVAVWGATIPGLMWLGAAAGF